MLGSLNRFLASQWKERQPAASPPQSHSPPGGQAAVSLTLCWGFKKVLNYSMFTTIKLAASWWSDLEWWGQWSMKETDIFSVFTTSIQFRQTTDGYIWASWLHSKWGEWAHFYFISIFIVKCLVFYAAATKTISQIGINKVPSYLIMWSHPHTDICQLLYQYNCHLLTIWALNMQCWPDLLTFQPPPKLPGIFSSEFQDFVNKWYVGKYLLASYTNPINICPDFLPSSGVKLHYTLR